MHLEQPQSPSTRGPHALRAVHEPMPRHQPAASRALAAVSSNGGAQLEAASQLEAELDAAVAAAVRPAPLQAALVLALLEAVPGPVFVLDARGRLEQANELGRSWLRTSQGAAAVGELCVALRQGQVAPGFSLTRLAAPEQDAQPWLARWTAGSGLAPAIVVERARRSWSLSERAARVLEQVACGRSNKEIATALGRSEVTVERNLTQLFRLAGCQSRAELIARLYAL